MTEEMRKRLDEAEITIRTEIVNTTQLYCHISVLDKATRRGMESGYKEAIEVAKEWLKENAHDYSFSNEGCNALLADFERNMNKLWEEKK